ncbi:carbohydrate ABC transporter permease [Quadrisphaera sp. DSM 44207]|uniref:carbohydrate ABC transporter permease n=1 Tax=Quadrisphaera sp. DSM 44207 TaxID=1881057 RepID=UPI00088119DE|nr:sugar ABC transporter permease [Quadrisphaera sp. DSM 44207]SDQ34716.1 carbohydrate ABC transporter membrane protein 1, CUT1 family [Quadrisphaera sp. DSM 44207]
MSTAPQVQAPRPAPLPPPVAAARQPGAVRGGNRGFWFTAPFLVVFAAFLLYPVVYGLYLAFTDATLAGGGLDAVGLANFAEALSDPLVWRTLWNTVFFTIASTVPLVVVPLAMALLVHLGLPGQWLWRLAFFAPYLLPVTVVSLIWVWIFQPQLGLLNDWLGAVGIGPIPWLQDESTAMWGIVIATVWWTAGFNFLLYLAALQNIPDHLYEAAALDGAGPWRQLRSITLPMLNRTTGLVVVLQILASLKVFDQIYQMTNGGPGNSTRSILLYVYDQGFTSYRLGYASAIANIFFLIIIVLSIAQLRLFDRREA